MRKLFISVVTTVAALLASDRLLGWYGPRHFIPEQRMQAAVSRAGNGCILILGDSRMAAGLTSPCCTRR